MRSFRIIVAFLSLLATSACSVTKHQLWKCLVRKGDKDGSDSLDGQEIRQLVRDNTYWYERIMKSPDSVALQVENHCTLPLTYGNILKNTCFRHCGGLDGKRTIYHRLCST